jgi:hypothetical protein
MQASSSSRVWATSIGDVDGLHSDVPGSPYLITATAGVFRLEWTLPCYHQLSIVVTEKLTSQVVADSAKLSIAIRSWSLVGQPFNLGA